MRRGLVAALLVAAVLAGCSDDGDSEAFCARLGDTDQLGQILGGLDPSDPAGTEDRLEAGLEQFRELEADAPGAIRDDVARVREGVELVLKAVRDNPDDLPGARDDITSELDELPGLAKAAQAVDDYGRDECDLDLSGDSEVETTTTTG